MSVGWRKRRALHAAGEVRYREKLLDLVLEQGFSSRRRKKQQVLIVTEKEKTNEISS